MTDSTSEVRALILHDEASTAALLDLADREEWTLIGDVPRRHDHPRIRTWTLPDGRQVQLADLFVECLRVVYVNGRDLEERLGSVLPYDDQEKILRDTRSDAVATRLRALRALPLFPDLDANGPHASAYLTAVEAALGADEIPIRSTALSVAQRLAWPEFVPLLERHRAHEDELAEILAFRLEQLAQVVISGGR